MSELQILTGGLAYCDESWESTREAVYKLYFPIVGNASLKIAGANYTIQPGRLILFNARHLEKSQTQAMDVHWLHFLPTSLSLRVRMQQAPAAYEWTGRVVAFFRPLLERIISPPTSQDTLGLEGMLMTLLADILKDVLLPSARDNILGRLQPAVRFMDGHWREHPSLQQIAKSVNLAPNYFHRLFRQCFGLTPQVYLTEKRLTRARELLISTSLSVSEVGRAVGYDCAFHFSKAFKNHAGRSPKQFRKELSP